MGNGITMNQVIDRIPGNPGRVLITPEDGGTPYYATVALADNPITEGTPINKALFDSMTVDIPEGSGALYIPATTGTNTYTATLDGFTEYKSGQLINVKFTAANTGASSLNINGLGAKNIVRGTSTALINGEIQANSEQMLVYGGSYFHLLSVGTLVQKANTASYWTTARTLNLTGDVTGSASIRGNANVSLATSLNGRTLKRIQMGAYTFQDDEDYTPGGSPNVAIPIAAVDPANCAIIAYADNSYVDYDGYGDYDITDMRAYLTVSYAEIDASYPDEIDVEVNIPEIDPGYFDGYIRIEWTVIEFND